MPVVYTADSILSASSLSFALTCSPTKISPKNGEFSHVTPVLSLGEFTLLPKVRLLIQGTIGTHMICYLYSYSALSTTRVLLPKSVI